jgi:L-asparaginase
LNSLENSIKNGLHIINVTQCSGGSVILGSYETSAILKQMQVVNGKDITTEAAVSKAMYMLGNGVGHHLFKTVFETPLRGEMK